MTMCVHGGRNAEAHWICKIYHRFCTPLDIRYIPVLLAKKLVCGANLSDPGALAIGDGGSAMPRMAAIK